ncbi:MAG TPA: PP2C family protein-serine/threonine phosphatase [Candidatus Sulfotelmatobacter sp.]|nr:PP2C family protein-serine/threonine phosphatase [Candidatus Sulfotelmatobacter sp.]
MTWGPLRAEQTSPAYWLQLKRIIRRQQSYIAIAVAIYAGLWAADRPSGLATTIIYTLPLCNLIALVNEQLGFLSAKRSPLRSWGIYLALVLFIAVVGVAVVNVIQYPLHKYPGQTLWQFLQSGWKLPFMATVIVGISTGLYRGTRDRLETKNRALQEAIEQETAHRERQEKELQQAREIQQSLLPKKIPQIDGFEIDGAWEPAREVGGDYFDVIQLSPTKIGICIADVAGKGVSAALLMANVQAIVRAFATESASPANLCGRVNSVLCSSIGAGKFVTLFYGVLDAVHNTFRYTSAGHLPPILIRADGNAQQLSNGGALLGVFAEWLYEDSAIRLWPGDRLLLFTDGITEAGMENGEEFGEERVITSALASASLSARDLKMSLLDDAKKFCGSPMKDDATLIVISALAANREAKGELERRAVISI